MLFWLDYRVSSRSTLVCRASANGQNMMLMSTLENSVVRSLVIDEMDSRVMLLQSTPHAAIISMSYDGFERHEIYSLNQIDESDTKRVVSMGVLKTRIFLAQVDTVVLQPTVVSTEPVASQWLRIFTITKASGTGRTEVRFRPTFPQLSVSRNGPGKCHQL